MILFLSLEHIKTSTKKIPMDYTPRSKEHSTVSVHQLFVGLILSLEKH